MKANLKGNWTSERQTPALYRIIINGPETRIVAVITTATPVKNDDFVHIELTDAQILGT